MESTARPSAIDIESQISTNSFSSKEKSVVTSTERILSQNGAIAWSARAITWSNCFKAISFDWEVD